VRKTPKRAAAVVSAEMVRPVRPVRPVRRPGAVRPAVASGTVREPVATCSETGVEAPALDSAVASGPTHQRLLLCKRCGGALDPRQGARGRFPKYCSRACRSSAMKTTPRALAVAADAHAAAMARRAAVAAPCVVCGGDVPLGRTGAVSKYCSSRCRDRRERERYTPRPARVVTCAECGQDFSVAGTGWVRVCRPCRDASGHRGPRAVFCEQCGERFLVQGPGGPGMCSPECTAARARARAAVLRLAKAVTESARKRVSPDTTKRLLRLARIAQCLVENAPRRGAHQASEAQ